MPWTKNYNIESSMDQQRDDIVSEFNKSSAFKQKDLEMEHFCLEMQLNMNIVVAVVMDI